MVVTVADTAINKDTVVVCLGDAVTAYTAMLGSRRFCLSTSLAHMAWNKNVVIVRIETAMYIKVSPEDVTWVHGSCEAKEDIWTEYDDGNQHFHTQAKGRQNLWEEHNLRYCHETKEEDLD
jgi:hypothetical protein